MPLGPNARAADDTKRVNTTAAARNLCSGNAYKWPEVRAQVLRRDQDKPCVRCGKRIDYTLPHTHPGSKTIDHMGTRVEDVVGMTKGDARRALHNVNQLAVAHKSCNSSANRPGDRPFTPPAIEEKPAKKPTQDEIGRKREASSATRWKLSQLQLRMGPFKDTPEDERQQLTHELIAKLNSEWRAA